MGQFPGVAPKTIDRCAVARGLAPVLLFLLLAQRVPAAAEPSGRILIEPRQDTYYVGQSLRLLLELEVADGALAGGLQYDGMPSEPWAKLGEFREMAGTTRTENGRLVATKRFATDLLLLIEGTHTFAPTLGGMVEEQTRTGWSSVVMQRGFRISAQPVTLVTARLPQPAPEDFCGAVGRFALRAAIEPDKAAPGDLVTLRWQLEGVGSLNDFRPLALDAVAHVKTYAPKVDSREEGTRVVVSQVFVPESLEATSIPELALQVFNPDTARYERLAAGPFPLTLVTRDAATPFPDQPPTNTFTPSVASPTAHPAGVPAEWRIPSPSVASPHLVLLGGVALALMVLVAVAGRSRGVAALLAAAIIGGAAALRHALLARDGRDSLVLATAAESRICPSATARPLRTLVAGTTVRVLERTERWLRVEHAGASGWIPAPERPSID